MITHTTNGFIIYEKLVSDGEYFISKEFYYFLASLKYMFIDFREGGGREGKRKGEEHRLVASRTHPNRGSNPQPRYVP